MKYGVISFNLYKAFMGQNISYHNWYFGIVIKVLDFISRNSKFYSIFKLRFKDLSDQIANLLAFSGTDSVAEVLVITLIKLLI